MKINKIKCFQFSNHFLISLHEPKSIDPTCLRYPVGKSAQGSNLKVTVEYSIKLLQEFSKIKGKKKAGGYVNVPSSPLTPSTPIWSLVHQRFRRIFVWFVVWGLKIKNVQMLFRNEQNFPKERLNCLMSTSETYHVISDKIAVTINSTIQNWAPSNWENLPKRRICNYAFLCIQHADWCL